ncbi:hypothetical protein C0995_000387, partial [Termitomyces sp. Mi166
EGNQTLFTIASTTATLAPLNPFTHCHVNPVHFARLDFVPFWLLHEYRDLGGGIETTNA